MYFNSKIKEEKETEIEEQINNSTVNKKDQLNYIPRKDDHFLIEDVMLLKSVLRELKCKKVKKQTKNIFLSEDKVSTAQCKTHDDLLL